jgi:hypothetical protein
MFPLLNFVISYVVMKTVTNELRGVNYRNIISVCLLHDVNNDCRNLKLGCLHPVACIKSSSGVSV